MATNATQLALMARRDAIVAALANLTTTPDYSIDGQQVSNVENRAALNQELKDILVLIQQTGGPFTVRSRGSARN